MPTYNFTSPLYVIPCAGLGNRIRAVVSGMCAAYDLGIELHVLWRNEPYICTAPFHTLFDMKSLPPWMKVIDGPIEPNSIWSLGGDILSEDAWDEFVEKCQCDSRPLCLKSHQAFYNKNDPQWLVFLQMLRVHSSIVNKATIYGLENSYNIVGVHIRRTDNKKAIQFSPSNDFWAVMSKYPDDTHFYVSSDSEEERREAERRFPGRILKGAQLGSRNSPIGCYNAMVDLYCLSRCSQLIGSYYSSFSEIAAGLGGIPLMVVKTP